jgi:hypothetical protein
MAEKERCNICGKMYAHSSLIPHIKSVHGIAGVTRSTLDRFNVAPAPDGEPGSDIPSFCPPETDDYPVEIVDTTCCVVDMLRSEFDGDLNIDDYLRAEPAPTIAFHKMWLMGSIAVITNNGNYLVKQKIGGKIKRTMMAQPALETLLNVQSAKCVIDGATKSVQYSKFLKIPEIAQALKKFRTVEFFSDDPTAYNIFDDWAFPRVDVVDESLFAKFLDHVLNIICGGNRDLYDTELKKNAWMFQNPNDHVQWATVLMGEEGAGKGRYTDLLCDLWGDNFSLRNITSMEQITGDKSRDLISFKKLIVTNEVQSIEDSRANFDVLKSRITDSEYTLRNLYEKEVRVRNVNNFIFCSNNYDSIRMGLRDRRYFVLEVSDAKAQDVQYFAELLETYTDEMKSHLLTYLLEMNTDGFNPFIPPQTDLKRELQKDQKPIHELWMEKFDWRDGLQKGLTCDQLWKAFGEWCDEMSIDPKYRGKYGSFGRRISKFVRFETRKVLGKATQVYFPLVPPPDLPEHDASSE